VSRREAWPRCEEADCDNAVRRDPVTGKGPAVDLRCSRHKICDDLERPAEVIEDEAEITEADEPENVVASLERVPSVRDALKEALGTAETVALMKAQLEQGLRAEKQGWGTCSKCKTRVPFTLPDLAGRVRAAETIRQLVDGTDEVRPTELLEQQAQVTLDELRAMTDDELARLYVDLQAAG